MSQQASTCQSLIHCLLLQRSPAPLKPTHWPGLELDPANAQLKQGLQDAKAAAAPRPAYSAPPPSPAGAGGTADYATRAGPAGQLVLLAAHGIMLLAAVATVQPLDKRLSWQAYFLFCRVALVASAYKVGGGVRAWASDWAGGK